MEILRLGLNFSSVYSTTGQSLVNWCILRATLIEEHDSEPPNSVPMGERQRYANLIGYFEDCHYPVYPSSGNYKQRPSWTQRVGCTAEVILWRLDRYNLFLKISGGTLMMFNRWKCKHGGWSLGQQWVGTQVSNLQLFPSQIRKRLLRLGSRLPEVDRVLCCSSTCPPLIILSLFFF